MTDQHDLQTPPLSEEPGTESKGGFAALFIALAVLGLGVAIGFAVIRAVLGARPSDPTTERIQSLIDEANRLLKELDDKKPA
jgi:divalent metal cation (Fe/Co/Zn/Cd) transporter